MTNRRICVLGAGIIGLSSAVCIQSAGIANVDVTVMADTFSPDTAADESAGFWLPYHLDSDKTEQIVKWGSVTFQHLFGLLRSPEASDVGATLLSGYQFCNDEVIPKYKDVLFGFRELTDKERLIHPERKAGVTFTSIVLDVKSYMAWLMNKFKSNGGNVVQMHVTELEELQHQFDVVVNCTGLGAYKLFSDVSMMPIRGQIIRVDAPWINHFYADKDSKDPNNIIYIIPGKRDVVLGGTSQRGNWSTEISQSDSDHIWQECCKMVPSLQKASVLREWAGLRPYRTKIRLELERTSCGGKIVHNYGHGGGGVSLHWGCALEAARLVKEAVSSNNAD